MKFATLDQIYDIPYCPVDDTTCPYYNFDNGRCMMDVMEGCPPYNECDAFDGYEDEMEELEEALYQEAEREKQNLLERKQSKDLEEDWRDV